MAQAEKSSENCSKVADYPLIGLSVQTLAGYFFIENKVLARILDVCVHCFYTCRSPFRLN